MTERPRQPIQQGLFGPLESASSPGKIVAPAMLPAELHELGRRLPPGLRLGTSSWNFPGWRGLVYAKDAAVRLLSSQGLHAYGQHPLFGTVGLDRTYYAPISVAEYAAYADAVPVQFRFLVKAWGELLGSASRNSGVTSLRPLDPDAVIQHCIEPALQGLGAKLGVLLLQFPPQGAAVVRSPEHFSDRLHDFLLRLPAGVTYAVELRDAGLLVASYAEALAATGVSHCYAVHPSQPVLSRQMEVVPVTGPVFVRWLLRPELQYDEAKDRYEPFHRVVDPDPTSRGSIVTLARQALLQGVPMTIVVNNKAEGCAPESVASLARDLALPVTNAGIPTPEGAS